MREYLSILRPLLEHQQVDFLGDTMRTRIRLDASVSGNPPPPVVLAALGDQMLTLAGSMADGVVTWMTGLDTIEKRTIPILRAAAAAAGRRPPRVIVGLPVMVTDDVAAARQRASEVFAVYGRLPSYRAMLDAEGATSPGAVAIVGDESDIVAALDRMEGFGATDFQATPFGETDEMARTLELLRLAAATLMLLTDFDALSFDCYGTLIDWEAGIAATLAPWALRHGVTATPDELMSALRGRSRRRCRARPRPCATPRCSPRPCAASAARSGPRCRTPRPSASARRWVRGRPSPTRPRRWPGCTAGTA